ncbi:MAG: cupin domain-containing protein [Porticoccaceae bacterium]
MKLRYPLLLLALFGFGTANAQKLLLEEIQPPADLDNIHVAKLNSDKNASDFIVFVKKYVPLHKHVFHTETIYILEGPGVMQLGDEEFEVKSGDYIKVPENTPHGVRTTSSVPLKALSVQAPEFFGKDRVPVE